MALKGKTSNLPTNSRAWVRVLELLVTQLQAENKQMKSDIAYLKKRVK